MKIKPFIIVCLLISFVSCVEETPYELGRISYNIKDSSVTPTSAVVTITMPTGEDNLLTGEMMCKLSNKNDPDSFWHINDFDNSYTEKYIYDRKVNTDGSIETKILFYNLKPNTTYHVVMLLYCNIYKNDYSSEIYYNPEYSFTTAKEGDYSNLGNFTCELIDYNDNGYTIVKFNLPAECSCMSIGDLIASTSLDMSNPLYGEYRSRYNNVNSTDNQLIYAFPRLDKTKYHFAYNGKIKILNEYTTDNIYINIQNALDLSNIAD